MAVGAALSRFCLAVFHCGRSLILSLFLFFNAYVIYIYNIVNTCADVGARVCLKVAFFFGYLKVSLVIVSGDATLLLIIG